MASDKHPFFTIVIPSYNRAALIGKTIESVQAQTFTSYEVIIVDDGSTDNTTEVVQPYLSDKIAYHKKENAERAVARNFGTKRAQGQYINWLDSDDLMLPNHLQVTYDFLQANNFPDVIHTGFRHEDDKGNVLEVKNNFPPQMSAELLKANTFSCNNIIVKKETALANLFIEDRELSASEDYNLWIRLAARQPVLCCNTVTVIVVNHENRSVFTMRNRDMLINRFEKLLRYTVEDAAVQKTFASRLSYFKMQNYLLLAQNLSAHKFRANAIWFLFRAFLSNPRVIFNKGCYIVFYNMLR
jgi:glycosyltransferase involved in cell wall biosynthesis